MRDTQEYCLEDDLISKETHSILKDLFGRTKFQMDRYIDSLYRLDREGKWKTRFNRNRS